MELSKAGMIADPRVDIRDLAENVEALDRNPATRIYFVPFAGHNSTCKMSENSPRRSEKHTVSAGSKGIPGRLVALTAIVRILGIRWKSDRNVDGDNVAWPEPKRQGGQGHD